MLEVFLLLIGCSLLAALYDKTKKEVLLSKGGKNSPLIEKVNKSPDAALVFAVLCVIMCCFSGLRTVMNDTAIYLANYTRVPVGFSNIFKVDFRLGSNPGFNIYQIILKRIFGNNGQIFIFVTSCFVVISYLIFLKKYSHNFKYVVFLLLATTSYAFTMAAIKQTIATAIGIWALPLFLQRKWAKGYLLLLLAATFHPYVLIFALIPLFMDQVWNVKTIILIFAFVLAGFFFEEFVANLLNLARFFADEYEKEMWTEGGLNIFRLLAYSVVPVLSFIYRKQINESDDKLAITCVNLSIVCWGFFFLASFGGANMFGRMGNYFDLFYCMSLTYLLDKVKIGVRNNAIIKIICVLCYCFFYYTYYSKYGTSLTDDYYHHESIISLFK